MFIFLLFQIRNVRVVKAINHGNKILSLGHPNENQNWF